MATYTYTLQTDLMPNGKRMVVTLYSEYTGLTIPSYSSLVYDADLVEDYDSIPGIIQLQKMSIKFWEDYTTYSEGFWYKVLQGSMEIQMTLDGSHYFWGILFEPQTSLEELSIIGADIQRQGEFTLISAIAKAKTIPYTDIYTEVANHFDTRGGADYAISNSSADGLNNSFCKVTDVIGSVLKLAFNQTFSTSDVTCPAIDIKFFDGSAVEIAFSDIYMWIKVDDGVIDLDLYQWQVLGQTGFDIIANLARDLFLVPRYYYDGGKHKIELLSRGRSYTASTFEVPLKSTYVREAYTPIPAWRSHRVNHTVNLFDKRQLNAGTTTASYTDIPGVTFEEIITHFIMRNSEETLDNTYGTGNYQYSLYSTSGKIHNCKFYNYQTAAFTNEDYFYVKYYYNRFGFSKRSYAREYATIESTYSAVTSFTNNYALRTTSINDNVAARSFYAAKVTLNAFTDTSTITWHEI